MEELGIQLVSYQAVDHERTPEDLLMAKTWLITGSSRGFGWELARAALTSGDRVVATARHPEQLDALVHEYGVHVRAAALDVTDAAAARAAVQLAVEAFGTLAVVVNNAGYAISTA